MRPTTFCIVLILGLGLTLSVAFPMIRTKKLSRNEVFIAMREGDFDGLESGLNRTNVNFQDEYGWTPLLEATRMDDERLVRLLVKKGARAQISDFFYTSPLILAAFKGNEELVDLFIGLGSNLDQLNDANLSPLSACAFHDDTTIAEILLDAGASVRTTAFFWAIIATNLELVELLIENGADITVPIRKGFFAHHLIFFPVAEKRKMFEFLGQYGFTVPPSIAERDVTNLAEVIIREGGNINLWSSFGEGALHLAAADPHYTKAAAVLIDYGFRLDCKRPSDFQNPLHIAIQTNNSQMVKLLLESGADPRIQLTIGENCEL